MVWFHPTCMCMLMHTRTHAHTQTASHSFTSSAYWALPHLPSAAEEELWVILSVLGVIWVNKSARKESKHVDTGSPPRKGATALMTVSLCSLLTWPAGRPSHVHSHHSDNRGKDTPAEGTGQWTSYHARKQWWNCLDGNKMWGSLIPATLGPGCTYRGTVDVKGSPSLLAHACYICTDIVHTTSHAREHYAEEKYLNYHRLRCFSGQSLAIMFVRTCWLTTPNLQCWTTRPEWLAWQPKGYIPCKIAHKVCTRNFATTEADLQLHSM